MHDPRCTSVLICCTYCCRLALTPAARYPTLRDTGPDNGVKRMSWHPKKISLVDDEYFSLMNLALLRSTFPISRFPRNPTELFDPRIVLECYITLLDLVFKSFYFVFIASPFFSTSHFTYIAHRTSENASPHRPPSLLRLVSSPPPLSVLPLLTFTSVSAAFNCVCEDTWGAYPSVTLNCCRIDGQWGKGTVYVADVAPYAV